MNLEFKITICISAFLVFGISVYALKCYECNSSKPEEKDCEDLPPDEAQKFLKECPINANKSCVKQEQYVEKVVIKQHSNRTIRHCSAQEAPKSGHCTFRTGYGSKVNVCHCTEHACNQAPNRFSFNNPYILGLSVTLPVLFNI